MRLATQWILAQGRDDDNMVVPAGTKQVHLDVTLPVGDDSPRTP
jgi:hypothetical protein